MSLTSTTILYPAPPPTSNILPSHQRTRLLRSTRKLGAVLGTTPFLLDSASSPTRPINIAVLPIGSPSNSTSTKALRRQGSIFIQTPSHSRSSSTESTVSVRPLPPRPLPSPPIQNLTTSPNPLLLRLNAVPLTPTDSRCPLSPLTPSTPSFSSAHDNTTTTNRIKRKSNYIFPPTPKTPAFDSTSIPPVDAIDVRRKRMAKIAQMMGENVPTELVFSPSSATTSRGRKRRSLSVSAIPTTVHAPAPARPSTAPRAGDATGAFRLATGPRQPSWTGEWNYSDMREVQKQLRALKL